MNCSVSPHMLPQFEYAHCQKVRFTGHRQIGLPCPVLKGLHIGKGPLQGFQSDILVRKVIQQNVPHLMHFGTGAQCTPYGPLGLTSDSWNLKGHTNFPSQLHRITHIWYGSQLLPPVGCIQLAGLPFQPHLIVFD